MKKTMVLASVILTVSFLLSSTALAAPFSPLWEWEQPKLVGKVKVIEEYADNISRRIFYDKEGRRTEAQRLDDKGKVMNRFFFVYDKEGNLVLLECYSKNNANPLRETIYYVSKGIIKLIDSFEHPRRAAFEYDEQKRIKDIIVMDHRGLTKAKWTFIYDDKGRFISERYTNMEGGYAGKKVLEYNDKGFISSQIVYNGKDQVTSKRLYTYEYDRVGNWVKKKVVMLDFSRPDQKPTEVKSVVSRKYTYYPDEPKP
ncbi:MAG: hypothetical protein HZB23_13255 [Deltaproteobacteria bacterium]|nr:hypothetical protein [Deltaproteobacteria bacterium]